jgi:elongation factor Tu
MVQGPIEEEKQEITVGVLGQDGHGKTSLTTAIVHFLARLNGSIVEGDEIVINLGESFEDRTRPFVYETESRHYTHVDCGSHTDLMNNLILNSVSLHGAILVVSAIEGVTAQTREQVWLANTVGVAAIVVFLNKCDLTDDVDLLESVEQEVRGLLLASGYSDDDPIIRGSATAALNNLETGVFDFWSSKIRELLDALDTTIPAPQRLEDKPFLMSVEEVFFFPSRKSMMVVKGHVERGAIRSNALVEVVGLAPTRSAIGTDMERFHKGCDIISAGDDAGMLIHDGNGTDAQRGQVLAAPGTMRAYSKFRSMLSLSMQRENGSDRLDMCGANNLFFFRNIEIVGTLRCEEGTDSLCDGDIVRATIELEKVVAMEPGVRFALRQNDRSIGYGVVTDLLY